MTREERLKALFDELERDAYNAEYHNYYYKEANQIIRKHFELSLPPAEGAEQLADLKQYMTNLLYYVADPANVPADQLDHWVEEMVNGIDEYFKSKQPTAEGAETMTAEAGHSTCERCVFKVNYDKFDKARIAYEKLTAQQPTAEGAGHKERSCYTCRYNPAMCTKTFDECAGKGYAAWQQPTAEGAEEILAKHGFFLMAHKDSNEEVRKAFIEPVLSAMNEFATLHAQRIADKMVSERCKKCKYRGLPDSINEALNSGDGVYRP